VHASDIAADVPHLVDAPRRDAARPIAQLGQRDELQPSDRIAAPIHSRITPLVADLKQSAGLLVVLTAKSRQLFEPVHRSPSAERRLRGD
jgi:hypothetical protein